MDEVGAGLVTYDKGDITINYDDIMTIMRRGV